MGQQLGRPITTLMADDAADERLLVKEVLKADHDCRSMRPMPDMGSDWQERLVKVLLIEDDEDDYLLTRDLLAGIQVQRFALEWVRTYEGGLEALTRTQHDVCLLDYHLG